MMNRRQLLGAAAGALMTPAALAEMGKKGDREAPFSFVMLGDIHFDHPDHHDMEWLAKEHPGDVRQVQNYSRITREITPKLLAEVRDQIRQSRARVPFALQIGDLVEGLCGTAALAQRQCEETIASVKEAQLGVPLVMTKGNHDIAGPGAVEAFDRVLLPAASGSPPAMLSNYSVRAGDALFLFFDAYQRGSLEWLEQALAKRSGRHLFFVIHPPVVPYNARSNWHVYARPNQAGQRAKLLGLLGKHRAIVLCGHLHKYACVVRQTEEGPFLQLAVSSVIPAADVQPRHVLSGLDRYGPDLVSLEPDFGSTTLAERRENLRAEKPFIRHWDYADTAGYAVLYVEGERVRADVYNGVGKRLWKTVNLSGLLEG
jgi:calcineurin-like phosphoesterase family protein